MKKKKNQKKTVNNCMFRLFFKKKAVKAGVSSAIVAHAFYLIAANSGRVFAKQLLAFKTTMLRFFKKIRAQSSVEEQSRCVQLVHAFFTVTKKAAGVRMGKGKGAVQDVPVAKIRAGQKLFFLKGVSVFVFKKLLKHIRSKISFGIGVLVVLFIINSCCKLVLIFFV